MKKVFAILFLLLYSASFSGMIWAKDCQQINPLKSDTNQRNHYCGQFTASVPATENHPLLQFCKLIKVHQEVVVSKVVKAQAFYLLPTLVDPLLILASLRSSRVHNAGFLQMPCYKLYLHNLRLLI